VFRRRLYKAIRSKKTNKIATFIRGSNPNKWGLSVKYQKRSQQAFKAKREGISEKQN
jgi:hypothetical protein